MKRLTTGSLMLSFLAGAWTLTASAQSPKIVVGIVVDQLRTDYLDQLRPYFGDKGFNRLISEGVYIRDVDFKGTATDAPTGTAVIYTGAWPVANGVAGDRRLDASINRSVPVLATDASKSKLDYSPENLQLSTIADEFYVNYGPLSKIYSVAGDAQVAVIAAGHAPGSAIWLDETTGRWNTPAYYGTAPSFVTNKNRTSPLSQKISSSVWRPLAPASAYSMGAAWKEGDFNYGFSGASRDAVMRFKAAAPFNVEATDMALDLLRAAQSASSTTGRPAMVNVAYTLSAPEFDYDGDSRPETVDKYVRLDAELGRLIDAVYSDFGKENAVIFLSSTGYALEPAMPETEARIPGGEITLRKVESLLNAYLSAQYGNGDFVALIQNGKLFLDAGVAERKGLDIRKLRADVKGFLLKMSGISEVITVDEVVRGDSRRMADLALGIDPKSAPDFFIGFTPGWTVVDDTALPETSHKVRLANPPTPAFILAPDLKAEVITMPVEATALAPTISSAIHIRAPNGASSKPLF